MRQGEHRDRAGCRGTHAQRRENAAVTRDQGDERAAEKAAAETGGERDRGSVRVGVRVPQPRQRGGEHAASQPRCDRHHRSQLRPVTVRSSRECRSSASGRAPIKRRRRPPSWGREGLGARRCGDGTTTHAHGVAVLAGVWAQRAGVHHRRPAARTLAADGQFTDHSRPSDDAGRGDRCDAPDRSGAAAPVAGAPWRAGGHDASYRSAQARPAGSAGPA